MDVVERWSHHEDDVRGLTGLRDRLVKPLRHGGVVVAAPHAVPHQRDGAVKRADMWTGGLALLLAELTGAGAVVETSGEGDPSWEPHAFKDALADLEPRAVLDLHAMRAQHEVIELGTGEPQGLPPTQIADDVRWALTEAGIATLVDHRFPARGEHTVVQWARARGVPAVQVELSVRLTPPFVSDADVVRLVGALGAAVTALDDGAAGTERSR